MKLNEWTAADVADTARKRSYGMNIPGGGHLLIQPSSGRNVKIRILPGSAPPSPKERIDFTGSPQDAANKINAALGLHESRISSLAESILNRPPRWPRGGK